MDAFGPGLKTRAQVQKTVDDAARLGVNTLFVQAIRRGDCLCLKSGLPLITDLDLEKNFDPLAVVTKAAHAKGIKVMAWVSVTGIANVAAPSRAKEHVLVTHGPLTGVNSWMARRSDGTWQEGQDGWLDAAIPEAAEYMTQAVVNLVKAYPVDGVQLDRIRYPDGGNWGYDTKTLSRYRAETGAVGMPPAGDPLWEAWKRNQITALVRRIALEVKAVRPTAWMSAATITYGPPPAAGDLEGFKTSRPYRDVVQDWPTWVREGLIDLNVPMNYKREEVPEQREAFDGWNAFAQSIRVRQDGQNSEVAAGTALYLNTPWQTASQVKRSVDAGLGWVGYAYRTPTLGVYQRTQSQSVGFETVAATLRKFKGVLVPPQQWELAPPSRRGVIGRVVGVFPIGGHDVELWQEGRLVSVVPTDANGYYGSLVLSPGAVEVRVEGQRWADAVPEEGIVRLPDLLLKAIGTPQGGKKP